MNKLRQFRPALAVLLLLTVGQSGRATSWRVNNNANRRAHFTDINAAVKSNKVATGDTLYLDPGCKLSSTQDVTKTVTIIGTGFFLPGGMQQATISGTVNLKAAKIKVEGLEMTGTVYLAANGVTLERCKVGYISYSGTAQNAIIRQCYIPNGRIEGAGTTDTRTVNWTIENSIIIYSNGYDPITNLFRPLIRNNYLRPNYQNNSASVSNLTGAKMVNNICINTRAIAYAQPYQVSESTIANNVFHAASVRTNYPDNVFIDNNTEETVFALEGTNDQRYQLKDDSPAKGVGTDGGDCGPYGGKYPYVPSGYPLGMPRFETSAADTRPQSGQVSVTQTVTIQKQ